MTGVLLLFVMMGFGFSGYLLPWNELAFFATKVGTGISGAVPVVGDFMVRFLRGGDEVTGATLTRFYGIHVAILPAITTVLLGSHLLFIQRQGMSVPPSVERREKAGEKTPQMPFFPHYVLHDVMWWYVALAVLAALALFSPWELGTKADAFTPVPAGIRPEWYFLAMFQVLKLLPAHIMGIEGEVLGVLGFGLCARGAAAAAVPGPRRRGGPLQQARHHWRHRGTGLHVRVHHLWLSCRLIGLVPPCAHSLSACSLLAAATLVASCRPEPRAARAGFGL